MSISSKQIARFLRKSLFWLVIGSFGLNTILPGYVEGVLDMPLPGARVRLSEGYQPTVLKGVKIYREEPFRFDFIIDNVEAGIKDEQLKKEVNKLIKYFLAALTVPEHEIWVNLSPYEKDRIIPQAIGQTEMGRDMLSQDYLLKQLSASLMSPDEKLGKEFWQRVNAKAQAQFGVTQVPVSTFNKVWIVPDQAVVYENKDAAFVTKSHLKVMMEEDYRRNLTPPSPLFKKEGESASTAAAPFLGKQGSTQLTPSLDKEGVGGVLSTNIPSQIIREIIIPELEKEVNEGKNFAPLRQMFYSMILAAWYKQALKESILSKVYANQNKVTGIESNDKDMKEKIYAQYVESFKKGAFNFIKEDYDESTQEMIPRKYFSGGVAGEISPILQKNGSEADAKIGSSALLVAVRVDSASSTVDKDAEFIRSGHRIVATMFPDKLAEEFRKDPFVLDLEQRFPDIFHWYVQLTKFSLVPDVLKKGGLSKNFELELLMDNAREFTLNEEKESLLVEILTEHIFHYKAPGVYPPDSGPLKNDQKYLMARNLVRGLVADGSVSFVRKLVNAIDLISFEINKYRPIIHGIAYQMSPTAVAAKRVIVEQLMGQVIKLTKIGFNEYSYLYDYLEDQDIVFDNFLVELQDLMISAFEKFNSRVLLIEPIALRMFAKENFTFDVSALEQLYLVSKSENFFREYIFVLLAQKYQNEQRRMFNDGKSVPDILAVSKATPELQKVYSAAGAISSAWFNFASRMQPPYEDSFEPGNEKGVLRHIDVTLKYLFDKFEAADDVRAFNEDVAVFETLSMNRALAWDFRDILVRNRIELEKEILLRFIQDPRIQIEQIKLSLKNFIRDDEFLETVYLSSEKYQGVYSEIDNLRIDGQPPIDNFDALKKSAPLLWDIFQKPEFVHLLINWLKIQNLTLNVSQQPTNGNDLPVIYLSAISDFNGAMLSDELLRSLIKSGRRVYYYEMWNLERGLNFFKLATILLPANLLIIHRHGAAGSDFMPSVDVLKNLEGRYIDGMDIVDYECNGGACGISGESSVQFLKRIFPNANVVGSESNIGNVQHTPDGFIFKDGRGNNVPAVTAGPQIPQRWPVSSSDSDPASSAVNPGGIDFNARLLNLRREGVGIDITLPQSFEDINLLPVQGLTPVIIQIIPMTNANLPVFLGNTQQGVEPLVLGAR